MGESFHWDLKLSTLSYERGMALCCIDLAYHIPKKGCSVDYTRLLPTKVVYPRTVVNDGQTQFVMNPSIIGTSDCLGPNLLWSVFPLVAKMAESDQNAKEIHSILGCVEVHWRLRNSMLNFGYIYFQLMEVLFQTTFIHFVRIFAPVISATLLWSIYWLHLSVASLQAYILLAVRLVHTLFVISWNASCSNLSLCISFKIFTNPTNHWWTTEPFCCWIV